MEPHLQPLSGKTLYYKTANHDDNAELDIAANKIFGGWGGDLSGHIRILTLVHPQINLSSLLTVKKRQQRVFNVSFTHLIYW